MNATVTDPIAEKYLNPKSAHAAADAVEETAKTVKAPIRVVKTVDEMYVEIEGFEPDDYAKGDAYLYAFKDENNQGDPDTYKSLKNKIIAWGVSKKVGSKTELRKVFEGDKGKGGLEQKYQYPHDEEAVTTANGFSCMDKFFGSPINYGKFMCSDEGGIVCTNPQGAPVLICAHPLIVSEVRENVNTREQSVVITYKYPEEKNWKSVVMPRGDAVVKPSLVKALANRECDITQDTADKLIDYIRMFLVNNRLIIPRALMSEKVGWSLVADKDEDEPSLVFIPFTEKIKFDVNRLGAFEDMGKALRAEGDPDVWLNGMREFRKLSTARQTILLMDGSFASPLVSLTDSLPFWMHMTGNGTTGKTVSMRMAATIWGNAPMPGKTSGGWMKTMNQTTNKLEELANFANNLPLCLNELQVLQRANPKLFTEFVYKICEGEGRGRLGRDGVAKKSGSFSLITLSCGEMALLSDTEHGGAKSRVIDLVLDKPIMPVEKLKPFCDDVLNRSYGHAGPMFLNVISSMDVNDIKAEIASITERLQKFGKATKQIDAAALLLFADKVAEEHIFKDGVRISDEEMINFLKDEKEIDDNVVGFDVLREIIAGNDNCFIDKEHHIEPRGETWGKIEDGGKKVTFIKSYFDREMRKAGYDPQRIIRWAAEKSNNYVEDGRIDKDGKIKAGESHIDKPVRGVNPEKPLGQTRCYVLHMDGGANPGNGYALAREYNSDGEEIKQDAIPSGSTNVSETVQTELPF